MRWDLTRHTAKPVAATDKKVRVSRVFLHPDFLSIPALLVRNQGELGGTMTNGLPQRQTMACVAADKPQEVTISIGAVSATRLQMGITQESPRG